MKMRDREERILPRVDGSNRMCNMIIILGETANLYSINHNIFTQQYVVRSNKEVADMAQNEPKKTKRTSGDR